MAPNHVFRNECIASASIVPAICFIADYGGLCAMLKEHMFVVL